MDKATQLSEDEIHHLEMVLNKKFINLTSARHEIEALVVKGYVCKKLLPILPMMPHQFNYELTTQGLILLSEYRPQYR